ncbi:MAG: MFS transporter [Rhodospirillaceae bacterium]|jgi:MFS family permease|nr:MFS transporter [Rhodospirillaceae bacterium]
MARFGNLDSITAALKQRNFAWYISGGSIALFGIWAQRLAIGQLTWDLTHDPAWIGLMAFADLFPTVILTPLAGVVADRVDRRVMSIITQTLGMLQAFALAALMFLGWVNVWVLLGLTFFIGVVWAFNTAARLSMVPNLMEPEHVSSAIALDSAVFNLARFIGPPIAAFLYVAIGPQWLFFFNGMTFAIFVFTLFKCRLLRDERGLAGSGSVLAQAVEGIRYAARHPGIGPILIVVIAIALGVKPVLELFPAVNGAVYKMDATGLGWMMSVSAVGAVLGSIWLAQRGTSVGLTRYLMGNLIFAALSLFGFCATENYVLGLIGVFFIGIAVVIGGTGTQALMQNAVDGAMRGRVMSLYGMIYRGVPALGALAIGWSAAWVGLQVAIAFGGVVCIGTFIWMLSRRQTVTRALEGE